jgi:hypothetical protein
MRDDPYEAQDRGVALVSPLHALIARDPEHEVRGTALPALDAVIEDARSSGSSACGPGGSGFASPDRDVHGGPAA